MLIIPESSIVLPARSLESRQTRETGAWLGHPLTVELYSAIDVTRLADRRSRSSSPDRPGRSRDLLGDWFALEPETLEPRQFARAHAVPQRGNEAVARLTHYAVWRLPPGTVLNVGRCGPLFHMPGLGFQAEFIEGPYLPVLIRAGRT